MEKAVRALSLVLGLASLFFGLAPVFVYGIVNTGVVALCLLGGLLLAIFWLFNRPKYLLFCRFGLLGAAICLGAAIGLSIVMFRAQQPTLPPANSVLVILGARVRGGEPSFTLLSRLQTALNYLQENPESLVVVSGGQSRDESLSEAAVMRNYLLANGIAWERILLENQATSTRENLKYTGELLRKQNMWGKNVVVVTNDFHQLRAQIYAGRAGLVPYPLSCSTPTLLLPAYTVREMLALLAVFLT